MKNKRELESINLAEVLEGLKNQPSDGLPEDHDPEGWRIYADVYDAEQIAWVENNFEKWAEAHYLYRSDAIQMFNRIRGISKD